MQLALCLYKYFPFGGLQRDFLRIAEVLVNKGHSVRVYTQSWQGDKPDFLDIILVPTSSVSNHGRNQQYHKWVFNHLATHPVDRIVGFNKMPGLDAYYAADVCYAEKVASEKSWWYKLLPRYKHYSDFETETVRKGLNNKLLIIADKQRVQFQKHYGTEQERFYLLPPGIAKDRKYTSFSPDANAKIRKELKLSSKNVLLLQIGSDFHRKGVDRSIIALANLPDECRKNTFLCVIGQDNATAFKSLSAKHQIESQIFFFNGRKDIPDFIAAADLFLHPARSENTGTVILEALVGGLPQMVTETCGYSPYINEAKSGIVIPDPFDQKTFNAALTTAVSDEELRRVWRDNSKHYADTHDLYSMPEKAAQIILD